MSILFVDCKYGISGDMMLASLVDLGADQEYISSELKKLPMEDFEMSFSRKDCKGISANQLSLNFTSGLIVDDQIQPVAGKNDKHHQHVHSKEHTHGHHHEHHHEHSHHNAKQIFEMIEGSQLPENVKENSKKLFKEVARAEGKIHGKDPEKVHFHEVGAMDSIIDIIGVCLALESLGVDRIIFTKVPTGSGLINIAHGLYPVPAPATAEILVGVPLSDFTYEAELTTPTGAAFAKVLADEYALAPQYEIQKIGYGCGKKEFPHPNILRTMILKKKTKKELVNITECQIDDMTGEELGFLLQSLIDHEGVLDAYYTAVNMKKNRPGNLLTVMSLPENTAMIENFILLNSSTFGVRTNLTERTILERKFIDYKTKWGIIKIKIGKFDGEIIKASPEYEDVAHVAKLSKRTFLDVFQLARQYAFECKK